MHLFVPNGKADFFSLLTKKGKGVYLSRRQCQKNFKELTLKAALSRLVPQEEKKVHSLHPRWRQLCQSSLYGRKLTRLPPILSLLCRSLPLLERVQTSDWTNATSLTDYETGPPATPPPAPPGWAPTVIFGSDGKLGGGQQSARRLVPQRSSGAQ